MRRGNAFVLKLVAAAAVCSACGSAMALLKQPDGAAQAAAAASSPARPITASAVASVPFGKEAPAKEVPSGVAGAVKEASKAPAGTLRELEDLQRQAALADLRKKVAELNGHVSQPGSPASPGVGVPVDASSPLVPPAATAPAPTRKGHHAVVPVTAPVMTGGPVVATAPTGGVFSSPPSAKLVRLLIVGSKARADLVQDGRLFTVKAGDRLGDWVVSDISPKGVEVEIRSMVTTPVPAMPQPAQIGLPGETRPAVLKAYAAVQGGAAGTPTTFKEVEHVTTFLLLPADSAALAAMAAVSSGQSGSIPTLPIATGPGATAMASGDSQLPAPPAIPIIRKESSGDSTATIGAIVPPLPTLPSAASH